MGYEYRGIPAAGAALDWQVVREVFEGLPDVEVVGRSRHGAVFVFRSVTRDRTRWQEDGVVELVQGASGPASSLRTGELYVLCHVGPHAELVATLQASLTERGHAISFEEL